MEKIKKHIEILSTVDLEYIADRPELREDFIDWTQANIRRALQCYFDKYDEENLRDWGKK